MQLAQRTSTTGRAAKPEQCCLKRLSEEHVVTYERLTIVAINSDLIHSTTLATEYGFPCFFG